MYKVTVNAATLVQCDPALGQGGYPTRAGQIIPSAEREFRVAIGHLLLLSLLAQYPFPIFVGSSPLLLMVKSPASGAQESGSNPSSAS